MGITVSLSTDLRTCPDLGRWGLSAALVKGTVGKILSRFASCHSASLSFGGMIPYNDRHTLALKQLCKGALDECTTAMMSSAFESHLSWLGRRDDSP